MPYLGEIRYFAGNFAPRGWALCDGQLLPVAQNTALFSILGTTYGGDGHTTFALPDLRGRAVMSPGQGDGLTPRSLGEKGGSTSVSLTATQIPSHQHAVQASSTLASAKVPTDNVLAQSPSTTYVAPTAGLVAMNDQALASAGGDQPHNNMQPYLTLNAIIALVGEYPPRS